MMWLGGIASSETWPPPPPGGNRELPSAAMRKRCREPPTRCLEDGFSEFPPASTHVY